MKLGIMQPYFFPYIGYFDLIHRTDHWIVFDTPQYIRHGWVNRNRILHPKRGWQYVLAPLAKHSRQTPIQEIAVADNQPWRERILGQLAHYRRQGRYYTTTIDLVRECLSFADVSLSALNVRILKRLCDYLGIDFRYQLFSEMQLPLGPVAGPGDWALRISESLGAVEYWNPPGGAELFDAQRFSALGVQLRIQPATHLVYDTRRYEYQPGLSIIDVLMWCRPEEVRGYLDACRDRGSHAVEWHVHQDTMRRSA